MHVACAAPRARALDRSPWAHEVDYSWQVAPSSLRDLCFITEVRSRSSKDISVWGSVTIKIG
jgi:hypothetical protein